VDWVSILSAFDQLLPTLTLVVLRGVFMKGKLIHVFP